MYNGIYYFKEFLLFLSLHLYPAGYYNNRDSLSLGVVLQLV